MKKDIATKLIDDIHNVPVFERHIRKYGYNMSDCSYVGQISIWSREIQVLVDIRKNVFKKALEKFVKQHKDVLEYAYFAYPKDWIPYLCFSVKSEYQS